jgi:hypothetical protein
MRKIKTTATVLVTIPGDFREVSDEEILFDIEQALNIDTPVDIKIKGEYENTFVRFHLNEVPK